MDALVEFYRALTNPEQLIALLSKKLAGGWGYALLAAIVFAETGLLIGFFLPGDSLLFTVGAVIGAGQLNLAVCLVLLSVCAIVGDAVGYALGRKAGPAVFHRPDSKLFKQQYLTRTQEFYERYGGKTIIYARFVPIVRTFAPFLAGVGKMDYGHFLSYNIFGGIGWVCSMTLAGYFLGQQPFVRRHFEKVVILIVVISVLPMIVEFFKARKRSPAS
jgi:membrane-associated protein